MRFWNRKTVFVATSALLLEMVGCGGGTEPVATGSGINAPAPSAIQSFTAFPAEASVGQTVTFMPIFTEAIGIIQPGNVRAISGVPFSVVATAAVTSYTLIITDPAGNTSSRTTSITIDAPQSSTISPTSPVVSNGGMISLMVNIPVGAMATIAGAPGSYTNGQTAVLPAIETGTSQTVNMLVTLSSGETQAVTATVALVPPPIASNLTAAPAVVAPGGTTTLTPTFSAGQGTIDGGVGAVVSGTGSVTTALAAIQTFTLTVTNAAGDTATVAATVGVVANPVLTSFTASTLAPAYGAPVTLTGVFLNGTGSVDNGLGAVSSGQAIQTCPITVKTVFTLTVVDAAGVTQQGTVTVSPLAVVVTGLPQGPVYQTTSATATFSASETGAVSAAISWYVDGVLGGNAAVGTISQAGLYTAPVTVGTHIVKAVSLNGGGASQSIFLQVVAVPTIQSFTVN